MNKEIEIKVQPRVRHLENIEFIVKANLYLERTSTDVY